MLDHTVAETRRADVRQLATELVQQSERCAQVGLWQQAVVLLDQVRDLTTELDPPLARQATWAGAWLLLEAEQYSSAARWFNALAEPPPLDRTRWADARDTLVRLCQALAPPAPAAESSTALAALPGSTGGPPSAPPSLPPLYVTNLGRFLVTRAGQPLPACKTRKSIAVFRYLLTTRHQAADKEQLMELFWSDADPRQAAHSLHVAVSALRRYLDPGVAAYVRFEAGRYFIDPDAPVEDDARGFAGLVDEAERQRRAGHRDAAQGLYAQAVAAYQGDYYVDDRDLAWAAAERERLLARYLISLDHLGRLYIRQGRLEAALGCYQKLLDRDGYREDAYCQLMRCYSRLGRRSEALRQYERCADLLRRDLGLDPMPETIAVYREILEGTPSGPP